jgi:hypothetical protein
MRNPERRDFFGLSDLRKNLMVVATIQSNRPIMAGRHAAVSRLPSLKNMKLNHLLLVFSLMVLTALAVDCGKKNATPPSDSTQTVAPEDQSPMDAGLVQRILSRAQGCLAQKKYAEATLTLNQLNSIKITPDQKLQADALRAQIPKQ